MSISQPQDPSLDLTSQPALATHNPPVTTAPAKKTNKMQILIVVLLGLVILIGSIIAYMLYTQSDQSTAQDKETAEVTTTPAVTAEEQNTAVTNTTIPTKQVSNTVVPTEVLPNDVPTGWEAIRNDKYGYTAYLPATYHHRFFGDSQVLGIDPSEIPEVGSHAGIITIQAFNGTLEEVKNDQLTPLFAIAEHMEQRDNATWTLIRGTIPADDQFNEQEIFMAFTVNKDLQVFVVDYRVDSADFATYESLFDSFYPAIQFDN